MSASDLRAKYGANAFNAGLKIQPQTFERRVAQRDSLDQNFTQLWLDFAVTGMSQRPALDTRTRLLVLVGQYTMVGDCLAVGEGTQARGHMRGAMRNGALPREVMEVIFQTCVNFGMPPMLHALESFVQIMAEDGRLAEIGNPPMRVESYAK